MYNDDIYISKLRSINKKISNGDDYSLILNEIVYLDNYLKKNLNEIEYFKKLDELLNNLSNDKILENKLYIDKVYKFLFDNYTTIINTSKYEYFSLIFFKFFKNKIEFYHPKFLAYLINILELKDIKNLNFSNKEDLSIFEIINNNKNIIIEILSNCSTYNIIFIKKIRNYFINFFFNHIKNNKKIEICLPFSIISLEPLVISYIINLLCEIDNIKYNNFKIFCFENNFNLIKKSFDSTIFNDFFINLKKEICLSFNIKLKDIKTNLNLAKKNIKIIDVSFLNQDFFTNNKIDFILINSIKNSNNQLFDIIKKNNINIIFELTNNNFIENNFFKIEKELLNFYNNDNDNKLQYFLVKPINIKKTIKQSNKINKNLFNIIEELYNNKENLDKKILKKQLNKINYKTLTNSVEKLKFSELLAICNHHTKSFEIIKKEFKTNYDLSYKILNYILNNTKNGKLKEKIETFIVNNHIKEQGFAYELLDALEEQIEEYFKENPDSKIKDMWV